ncbi:deoxynucleoside triphosphate triphosphohydrolase SAMHD1 homolog [Medicago truncatula]|uniref:Metal-dependent phosphohydrolase n=2 Tax=Medicago truncatula TaxID=3880 RepID=G7K1E7_MEDTR|nr:deoxynucleoside triphosphate triphosphohydrolase SAMHD1 homolog [Medicago truncatula]AES96200.2 metal-dependent phosphohydrolase [Medicago truncatula]
MITDSSMAIPASLNDSVSLERKFLKHIRDNVHGNIFLEPIFLKFVDTEQFQRLRDLKQLGLSHMVYPGAVHSRFEHSLGVYCLAGKAIDIIKKYQGPELGIDRFDVLAVKLAGLLHDVGHGPFSHTFERGFLPLVLNGPTWSHEEMSEKMIDYIVDEHNIDLDSQLLKKVKEMITSSSVHPPQREKKFLYDIVANGRNGIDVDKFDYIVRDSRACGLGCNFQPERLMETMQVMDDEICYRSTDYLTTHKLFATRADLHRTVYTHAKVKAIELMVLDALVKADPYLHIASSIHQPSEFWKLDDSVLKTIECSSNHELEESRKLVLRIRRRDLYQLCNEFSVPKEKLDNFKSITPQDIVCSQINGTNLKEDDVAVSNVKIDLTRGMENPLERIKFFKDYGSKEKFPIENERISHLLPAFYEDIIVRVYSKKPELVEAVSAAFANYQLKTFGREAQVHETPKKKQRLTHETHPTDFNM